MAEYTRFEVYLPVWYRVKGENKRWRRQELNWEEIDEFLHKVAGKYGGISQANPLAPAPLKGWWKRSEKSQPVIDFHTYLICLVEEPDTATAMKDFTEWKTMFQDKFHQEIIVVMYFQIQTIGKL